MHLTSERFSEIVQSLRSDAASAGKQEQRKAPRVGIRGRVTVVVPSKAGARSYPAMIRDLSANGIAVLVNEQVLKAGMDFLIVLPSADGATRTAVFYTAKRCQKLSDNQFSVGGAFVREMKTDAPAAAHAAAAKHEPMPAGADERAVGELEQRLKAAMLA